MVLGNWPYSKGGKCILTVQYGGDAVSGVKQGPRRRNGQTCLGMTKGKIPWRSHKRWDKVKVKSGEWLENYEAERRVCEMVKLNRQAEKRVAEATWEPSWCSGAVGGPGGAAHLLRILSFPFFSKLGHCLSTCLVCLLVDAVSLVDAELYLATWALPLLQVLAELYNP